MICFACTLIHAHTCMQPIAHAITQQSKEGTIITYTYLTHMYTHTASHTVRGLHIYNVTKWQRRMTLQCAHFTLVSCDLPNLMQKHCLLGLLCLLQFRYIN